MTEQTSVRRRGIALKTPEDVRRIIRRVVNAAFAENQELEYSGRISQLLSVWLKAFEISKLEEIEKRLTALEERNDTKRD